MSSRRKPHAVAAAEDALLRCVRARGVVARGDLAAELGLVPSTIGVYVERLVRDGYLLESIASERSLGRPPVLLELNPRRGRFIGLDFDARNIMALSVDFAQQPLRQVARTFDQMPTAAEVLAAFETLLEELIGPAREDVLGIGIGLPGFIDAERGIARRCRYIEEWRDVPVVDHLQHKLGLPVSIENNLRSMALAEYLVGQGRGLSRVTCLGVRTGIGLGIVIDGELYRGMSNIAGEIGAWFCPDAAPASNEQPPSPLTNGRMTVEDSVSLTALLDAVQHHKERGEAGPFWAEPGRPTFQQFRAAVEAGDPLAKRLLEQAAVHHAWLTHHVTLLLDPDRIILAGPLLELPGYFPLVQRTCLEAGGDDLLKRVTRTELGPYGGAMGAASIAIHHWRPR